MGVKSLVKQILTEQQNKKYAGLLAEKAVSYDQWIREQEKAYDWKREKTLPEAPLEQKAALKQIQEPGAAAEYVGFVMPEGCLAAGAVWRIARCFAECPEGVILYGDEDIIEPEGSSGGGKRRSPWFKPDWSPDLLHCSFYFGSMVAMRKTMWEQVSDSCSLQDLGLEKSGIQGGILFYQIVDVPCFQDYIRRLVKQAGGYRPNSRAVIHVPEMLFHGYNEEIWDNYKVCDVTDTNKEINRDINVNEDCPSDIAERRLLSIIIPSKDNPDILENCIRAIPAAAGTLSYEVIIVDNGSNAGNRQRIEKLVKCKDVLSNGDITYIYHPMEFHFSKMCNLGAEAARGELLLFLNDDVELVTENSLEKMAALAVQEYTGAAGIKLYYPNSVKIQHAGITNLPMGPVHKLQFLEDDKEYYFGYNRGCRNVLAVTAACLMVGKEKFRQAGGFAEELPVAFNDVDFCLQLYQLGYYNVCRNDVFAYHHESLSRGDDESVEKLSRLLAERDKLYERNPKLFAVDPYYGVGLGRAGLDTGIRPAYVTAGNQVQKITGTLKGLNPEEYRQDNCLLFRVEEESAAGLLGYGVVLGDNNACYDRWLVFQSEAACLCVKAEGQYRPDLVENMPDQINVGLCGYWVRLSDSLPEGEYRIGMAVSNRVTGLKLINWSNRKKEIRYRTKQ